MDSAEPSTNGVSATNLFRLATLLEDDNYEKIARGTLSAFEAEIMQYPWLFASFMPGIVAAATGVKGIVRVGPASTPPPPSTDSEPSNNVTMAADVPIVIAEDVVAAETTKDGGLVQNRDAVDEVKKTDIKDVAGETSADSKIMEQGEAIITPTAVETKPVLMDLTESDGVVEAGERRIQSRRQTPRRRNQRPILEGR
jgi:uncharacterized protein YyaL (SSP411 family)